MFSLFFYKKVIKNGTVLEKIVLNKEFVSLGRLGDILCEHPSLSRFHAILQYSNGQIDTKYPQGFYLLDLNSTHGTIMNKTKINPNHFFFGSYNGRKRKKAHTDDSRARNYIEILQAGYQLF